jgi:hypothetical protein
METLLSGRIKMRRKINAFMQSVSETVALIDRSTVQSAVRDRIQRKEQQMMADAAELAELTIQQQLAVERQHYLLVGASRKRTSCPLDDPSCTMLRPTQQAKRQAAAAIGTRGATAGARRVGGAAARKKQPPKRRVART